MSHVRPWNSFNGNPKNVISVCQKCKAYEELQDWMLKLQQLWEDYGANVLYRAINLQTNQIQAGQPHKGCSEYRRNILADMIFVFYFMPLIVIYIYIYIYVYRIYNNF